MDGRRLASVDELEQPGDYCGPVELGGTPGVSVFFIAPNAGPETLASWPHGRLFRVQQPPHAFRECEDGSLEIRESIRCLEVEALGYPGWHGYLDEGHVWRTC